MTKAHILKKFFKKFFNMDVEGNGVVSVFNYINNNYEKLPIGGGGSGGAGLESITYAELLAKRNSGTLTPGGQYRITDYVCTTTQAESRAVSHPFDIIVVADDESTLNENAKACLHEGDTYYTAENHSANLEAWELKYCIDNDRNRFGWADETNGKGVVFWLKDERGNECPYDFKQIQFKRYKITECIVSSLVGKYTALQHADAITAIDEANPIWAYTFSLYDSETQTYEDGSVAVMILDTGCYVHSNVVECYRNAADLEEYTGPNIPYLNNIVFFNTFEGNCNSNIFEDYCSISTFGNNCSGNTFGVACRGNTFGDNCSSNALRNNCDGNIFGNDFNRNTFENNCNSNIFGDDFNSSIFGNNCGGNIFGDYCGGNIFGDFCNSNSFGNNCNSNTFGDNCSSNTFGNNCNGNTFGNDCNDNTFGNNCNSNIFGDDCYYIDMPYETGSKQYFNVLSGTKGTYPSHLVISGMGSRNYVTYVGLNSSGLLKTWVPADQVQ